MNSIVQFPALVRLFCLVVFGMLAPALRAQSPTHIYEFDGNLDDALGGYAMSSGGGTTEAFRYSFGAGYGPSVPWAVPTSGDYSLEMVFTFTSVPAYACLVNFSDLQQDAGIYIGDGALPYLAPSGGTASGFSITPLTANVPVRVVVTRNWSTQETKIYMNGTLAKTKSDTGNIYVPPASGVVHFFRDNTAGNYQGENAPGSVDRIRIYNYVLSAGQVSSLGGPKGKADVFSGTVSGTRLVQGSDLPMGSVNLGNTSAAQTITVRNSGPVNLQVLSVSVQGGTADFFTSAPATTTLAQGQTMTFQVWFSPSATGYRTGSFNILDTDPEGSIGVGLNGTGVAGPPLAPAHEFEFSQSYADSAAIGNEAMAVQPGGTLGSATHTFPANGYLTGPANLVSDQYEYTLEAVFRLDDISGYRSVINFDGMAGDDAVFVQDGKIRFRTLANVQPSVAAPVTAAGWHRLIVTRKAVNNQLIAYVDGVAVLTTTDQINRYAADTRVRFFGDSTPEVSAGVVSLIRSYNGVMPPAQVTARGAGTLTEIQVQEGTALPGVERADNAAAYAMPNTATGNTSAVRSFDIVNTGVATLNISSMTLGGSNPGDFAVTNMGAVNLPAGSTRVLGVTFTPTALGTRTATITINSNDADEQSFEINLTGTGVVPPTVTAINPAFGTAAGGTQVTITGTGLSSATGLTIGGAALLGFSANPNGTTITGTTAARNAGPCSVQVLTPVGTNAANTLYSYKAVTTTNLARTSSTVPYGQAYPVTVTVNATNPYQTPAGSVSLKEGATIVASTTRATPGTWTFSPVGLNVGAHTVTAQYDGDEWNLLSTSAPAGVTFTVTQAAGALALTSSLNPMTQGESVTYTATLTPPLNNVTITFKDGTTSLGSAATNAAGVASLAVTPPMAYGTRSITAVFGGNTNVSLTTSPVLSQVVNQNANAIALTNLTQTYDGTPKTPGAATVPANRTVNFTYADGAYPSTVNQGTTPPTNAGTYSARGTISDPFWGGTAGATFIISKAPATVNVTGLSQYFDGLPKPVTVTTVPAGRAHTVTYNGSPTAPSAQGSYTVVVTVTDPNYTGLATETLTISTAAVTTTTLTSSQNPSVFLTQPTFTARATSVTSGLNGQMALYIDSVLLESKPVDAGGYATFTPPADKLRGGSRAIKATFNGDQAVGAFAPSTVTITQVVNKAPWTFSLSNLSQEYNITARVPSVNLTPPATHQTVAVDFTYDGSPVAPVNVGTYAVVATINDPSLQGTASGTLEITRAPMSVGFSRMAVGYDGQPHAAAITTSPAVPVTVTYQPIVNGALTGTPTATPPSEVGSYRVVVSNPNFVLAASDAPLTITLRGVSITLGALSVIGDGTPKPVTVVTDPPGVNVAVTYTAPGGTPTATAPSTPPEGGGLWRVDATVSDANLAGTARADLNIRVRQPLVLTLSGPPSAYAGAPTTYLAIMPPSPTGFAPTGLFTFKQEGTVLGTATVDNTGAACPFTVTRAARIAPWSLTVEYAGDADFFPAVSSPKLTIVSKRTIEVKPDSPLTVTYDGSPKRVAFTTDYSYHEQIPINVTYVGDPEPWTNATQVPIPVVATIDPAHPFYQGTVTVDLTINRAPATIRLGNLYHLYNSARPFFQATATTEPAGLSVDLTYDDDGPVPYQVGSYAVRGTLRDGNYTASDVFGTLQVANSDVTFTIGTLSHQYDGTPKAVTVTAVPAVKYVVTYSGDTKVPVGAGIYHVEVSADQPPYSGKNRASMTIYGEVSAVSWDSQQPAVGSFKLNGAAYLEPGAAGSLPHFPVQNVTPGVSELEFIGRETPTEKWTFDKWEDGSRNHPLRFIVGGSASRLTHKAIAKHHQNLLGTASPANGGTVRGPGWVKDGDTGLFSARPADGYVVGYWTYNNQTLPGFIENGLKLLKVKVVPGGGSPTAHFTQGYAAEAVSADSDEGSAKLVRADRVGVDAPVQVMGIPHGINFIATATPEPGYKFSHWSTSGAKPVSAGRFGVSSANPQEFQPTADFAQVIPKFILNRPDFEVEVTRVDEVYQPLEVSGVDTLTAIDWVVKNVGGAPANNARITAVAPTGFRLSRADATGSYDDYYPNPANADEIERNAKSQIPANKHGTLNLHAPFWLGDLEVMRLPAGPTFLSELGTIAAGDSYKDGSAINWSNEITPQHISSSYDYIHVRLTFTIEYDGGTLQCDTWTELDVLREF